MRAVLAPSVRVSGLDQYRISNQRLHPHRLIRLSTELDATTDLDVQPVEEDHHQFVVTEDVPTLE